MQEVRAVINYGLAIPLQPMRMVKQEILDTVSAPHDLDAYLGLLKTDGTMILVGAPDKPAQLGAFPLILKRRRLVGSLIGGIKETQAMLDFCSKHNIGADVEVIPIQQINAAYDRLVRGDVRYRFVIDMQSWIWWWVKMKASIPSSHIP